MIRDEKIYLPRVVDAYFGGTMVMPYLAEHQISVKIMPEFAERLFAFAARKAGCRPSWFHCDHRAVACPLLDIPRHVEFGARSRDERADRWAPARSGVVAACTNDQLGQGYNQPQRVPTVRTSNQPGSLCSATRLGVAPRAFCVAVAIFVERYRGKAPAWA